MLTPTQEAQVIALINQQAALLSLASNESTITSKLAATKVNLSQLSAASSLSDTDLMLVRQGGVERSSLTSLVKTYAQSGSVLLSGNQTIGGTKTFSSPISGSITGNSATVTNGVYTTGNQTIGGTKTFSTQIIGSISGNSGTSDYATNAGNASTANFANSQPTSDNGSAIANTAFVKSTGLGWGQTWQSTSRSLGVTYFNTTGKPICVHARCNSSTDNGMVLTIGGVVADSTNHGNFSNTQSSVTGVVPEGASYLITASGSSLAYWSELR